MVELKLLEIVPLVDETDAFAADFVEFFFVVDHFFAAGAGDGVVLAEVDGLLWADFFAESAVDTTDHVDLEFFRLFLDLCPSAPWSGPDGCL